MGSLSSLCTEAKDILAFAGWILTFFKIAIPLLIIGLGMFDFGKAVVSSKDDEIKKSAKTLMYRAIAGIVIFFVTSHPAATLPTSNFSAFGNIKNYYKEIDDLVVEDEEHDKKIEQEKKLHHK